MARALVETYTRWNCMIGVEGDDGGADSRRGRVPSCPVR
jgi:hypothetical protein